MKILVTGGAGFIGSNFVRMALTDKFPNFDVDEIIVLDLLTYAGDEENLAPIMFQLMKFMEVFQRVLGQKIIHFYQTAHIQLAKPVQIF